MCAAKREYYRTVPAHNTANNGTRSFDMAMLKLNLRFSCARSIVALRFLVDKAFLSSRHNGVVCAHDGRMLNEVIVRSGFAFASSYPPNIKYQEVLQKAQHEAEQANTGLWEEMH